MYKPSSNSNFHHIRSSFESLSKATSPPPSPDSPPANPQSPRLRLRKSVHTNIMIGRLNKLPNSLLQPVIGSHQRPSWIGPPTEIYSRSIDMAQKVKITYSSPGLKPPVFLTSSLSQPQWQPIEMDFTVDSDGEHHFSKELEATEGHYQYKFRLGHGDWWVFDEGQPTVDDGFGNKNNLLVVEQQKKVEEKAETSSTVPLLQHDTKPAPEKETSAPDDSGEKDAVKAEPDSGTSDQIDSQVVEEEHAPLLKHEMRPIDDSGDNSQPSSHLSIPDLLRPSGTSQTDEVIAPEPNQADKAILEKFPEDHDGIMESIRRVSSSVPTDEVSEPNEAVAPRSRALSSASSSLPSVQENVTEETKPEHGSDNVIAVPETSAPAATEEGQASRPTEPITPPMTPKDENKPHAPVHQQEALEEECGKGEQKVEVAPAKDDETDQAASSDSTPKASLTSPERSVASEDVKKKSFFTAFFNIILGVGHWFSRLCGGKAGATAVIFSISIGIAAGAWKLGLAEQSGLVFEKSTIIDRLRELKLGELRG